MLDNVLATASILGFPSKEIPGKPYGEILTHTFPVGNLQLVSKWKPCRCYPWSCLLYLFLLFTVKEIHRRFPCSGKAAVLRICYFSWNRKSNNSGSVLGLLYIHTRFKWFVFHLIHVWTGGISCNISSQHATIGTCRAKMNSQIYRIYIQKAKEVIIDL